LYKSELNLIECGIVTIATRQRGKPIMRITKLTIKNFRGIREMELDFHEKMNVLIGINGAGKSSVLDAIATMLSWWDAFRCKMRGPTKWQGEKFLIIPDFGV